MGFQRFQPYCSSMSMGWPVGYVGHGCPLACTGVLVPGASAELAGGYLLQCHLPLYTV